MLSQGSGRVETESSKTEDSHSFVQKARDKGYHRKVRKEIMQDQSVEISHDFRRVAPYFYVEVGPGSYKSEQVTYPPDYLKNQLMKLMRLKEKRERIKKFEESLTASSVVENATETVTGEGEGEEATGEPEGVDGVEEQTE